MRIQFYLRFKTSFGQSLWISDNGELGTDLIKGAIPMTYLNDEFWVANIKIDKEAASSFHYKYILQNKDGEIVPEFGKDRFLEVPAHGIKELQLIDTWNHAGEYENAFYSTPFADILLKRHASKSSARSKNKFTHIFTGFLDSWDFESWDVFLPNIWQNILCSLKSFSKMRDSSPAASRIVF